MVLRNKLVKDEDYFKLVSLNIVIFGNCLHHLKHYLYTSILKNMGGNTNLFFKTLLIGVKGAQTPPKMLTHFPRAWVFSGEQFNVLRDQRDR